VITVAGDVDAMGAKELEIFIGQVRRAPGDQLVFDLSKAALLDAQALRVLLGTSNYAHRHGGEVRLVALQPGVLRLMDMITFNALVPVYATLEHAVRACMAAGPPPATPER